MLGTDARFKALLIAMGAFSTILIAVAVFSSERDAHKEPWHRDGNPVLVAALKVHAQRDCSNALVSIRRHHFRVRDGCADINSLTLLQVK